MYYQFYKNFLLLFAITSVNNMVWMTTHTVVPFSKRWIFYKYFHSSRFSLNKNSTRHSRYPPKIYFQLQRLWYAISFTNVAWTSQRGIWTLERCWWWRSTTLLLSKSRWWIYGYGFNNQWCRKWGLGKTFVNVVMKINILHNI